MINSVKTDVGGSSNNKIVEHENNGFVENVDVVNFSNSKININDFDLDRISISGIGVSNGEFVKVNKSIWSKADLNVTDRGNGIYLIKNGDIPFGFTDEKGIKFKSVSDKTIGSKTSLNVSKASLTPVVKFGDINYKNGLFYDRSKEKLFYNDVDLSFLVNDGYATFSKIPSAKIEEIDDRLIINFFDDSSVILNDKYVIDKKSDGSTDSVMFYSNGKLSNVDGKCLYDSAKSNDIVSIKNSDYLNYYKIFEDMGIKSITDKQKLENDKLVRYYSYVDKIFGDDVSISDKYNFSKSLLKEDEKNYNYLLYSTPLLKNGKISTIFSNNKYYSNYQYNGNYLEYFNDAGINIRVPLSYFSSDEDGNLITKSMDDKMAEHVTTLSGEYYSDLMENSYKYSDKFKNTINENLKDVVMIYEDENFDTEKSPKDWVAYTSRKNELSTFSEVAVRLSYVEKDSNYMVDSYTHELGHAYANATGFKKKKVDSSSSWKEVFKQVNENDSSHLLLRDYAHSVDSECFAECVAEYFASGNCDIYNPNDLKVLSVDIDGYDNMYDYMTSLIG